MQTILSYCFVGNFEDVQLYIVGQITMHGNDPNISTMQKEKRSQTEQKECLKEVKYLGVTLDDKFKWNAYLNKVTEI